MRPRGAGETPEGEIQSATDTMAQTAAPFKVVLFNDEEHTYDYVVEMLTLVCRLSRDNAFRCAVEVDLTGTLIVDKSMKFRQELGQWSNPAAFILV